MSRYEIQQLKNLILGAAIMFGGLAVLTGVAFIATIVCMVTENQTGILVMMLITGLLGIFTYNMFDDLREDLNKLESETTINKTE